MANTTYDEFLTKAREDQPDLVERLKMLCSPRVVKTETGQLTAMLAYCLGVDEGWTNPSIVSLSVTSDNFLMGRKSYAGDDEESCYEGGGDFFGSADDLLVNLKGFFKFMQFNEEEIRAFVDAAKSRVRSWSETFSWDVLLEA